MKNAVVLWTGGKDSYLAYSLSKDKYNIKKLVVFIPRDADFKAHPLHIQQKQALALELPLDTRDVCEPYRRTYVEEILKLKNNDGIEVLITGDIDYIDGYPNWIKQCADTAGLDVYFPLWQKKRQEIFTALDNRNASVIVTCTAAKYRDQGLAGSILSIEKLLKIEGIDLCGENGEYHTLVFDAVDFKKKLQFGKMTHEHNNTHSWVEFDDITLHTR